MYVRKYVCMYTHRNTSAQAQTRTQTRIIVHTYKKTQIFGISVKNRLIAIAKEIKPFYTLPYISTRSHARARAHTHTHTHYCVHTAGDLDI